jgi:acyl carrier protein
MTADPTFEGVIACIRAAARHTLPEVIQREHAFVTELGFDSMSIARLALALEDRFHQALPLDEWIAEASDPRELTVASLCDYVAAARRGM